MYRWLAEKLGNVSVKTKLAVGFGLVLILTLVTTFTGWTGLGSVISRGDKLGYISSLNELTKDLRLARLDYEMRRGEQGPAAVNALLVQLEAGLKTADSLIDQPADNLLVDDQLVAVDKNAAALARKGPGLRERMLAEGWQPRFLAFLHDADLEAEDDVMVLDGRPHGVERSFCVNPTCGCHDAVLEWVSNFEPPLPWRCGTLQGDTVSEA